MCACGSEVETTERLELFENLKKVDYIAPNQQLPKVLITKFLNL